MSKTITVQGGIYLDTEHTRYSNNSPYKFFEGDCGSFLAYQLVTPYSMTFTPPEDFDPVPLQVQALEKKKKEVQAQATATVTAIDARIQSLLAITYEPEAA